MSGAKEVVVRGVDISRVHLDRLLVTDYLGESLAETHASVYGLSS